MSTTFINLFEIKQSFLVAMHLEWPWPYFFLNEEGEPERLQAYLRILEGILARPEPTIWVQDRTSYGELGRGPWSPYLERMRTKAVKIIEGGEHADFTGEAVALKRFTRGTPLVLCGFYRNLCVRGLRHKLMELGVSNITIARDLCPNRFVY